MHKAGLSRESEFTSTLILMIIGFAVNTFVLERAGRRPVLITGLALLSVSLFCLSIISKFGIENKHLYMGLFNGYTAVFDPSMGCTPWIVSTEVHQLRFRSIGSSLAAFSNYLVNAIITITLPMNKTNKNDGSAVSYFVYGVSALCSLILIYMYIPETAQTGQDTASVAQKRKRNTAALSVGWKKQKFNEGYKKKMITRIVWWDEYIRNQRQYFTI